MFCQIFEEYNSESSNRAGMLRALLLQLFALAERQIKVTSQPGNSTYPFRSFATFEMLLEQHYSSKKLPKEYAEMLFITPNYLNALCTKHTGRQAGDLIRSRILLEAKRLLSHSDLTISEISWQLNFGSNSYFSRFFKKYENITPEIFRKTKAALFRSG